MAETFSGSVGLNDGQTIPIGINLSEIFDDEDFPF